MVSMGIIFSTFAVVFFAELGDKTQLVAFSMTSTSRHPLLIFLATSLALSLSSVAAALIGGFTANFVPGFASYISAALFLGFGCFILISREPPKIKECFLKSITLENTLIRALPKLLKKMGRKDYQLLDIIRQEKSHSEIFRVLLKEKKLFQDDINEDSQLNECVASLDLNTNLLKLPVKEALDIVIGLEEAGYRVFRFILDHLVEQPHHHEISLQNLLETLLAEEEQHIRFYRNLQQEVIAHGQ